MVSLKYEVEITKWDKTTQTYIVYTVTVAKGGTISQAPFGYSQYIGVNLLDIIRDYQHNNVSYRWSKTEPLVKKGYSPADAIAIVVGKKEESECLITPNPK